MNTAQNSGGGGSGGNFLDSIPLPFWASIVIIVAIVLIIGLIIYCCCCRAKAESDQIKPFEGHREMVALDAEKDHPQAEEDQMASAWGMGTPEVN